MKAQKTIVETDLTGPRAIVLGSEGSGLRRLTALKCDFLMKIPMMETVDSLNVSVAAGICLFEALRQRTTVNNRANRGWAGVNAAFRHNGGQ